MNGLVHVNFHSREKKVVVLHCVPLVCTWMDDVLMVSMDAVVRGELMVNCTALMQYACCPESNLRGNLLTFYCRPSDICP